MKTVRLIILLLLLSADLSSAFEIRSRVRSRLVDEVEAQKDVVCRVENCTNSTYLFLKYLGLKPSISDGTIYVNGYSTIERVEFEGLPSSFRKEYVSSIRRFLLKRRFSESVIRSTRYIVEFRLKSMGYREARVETQVSKSVSGYSVKFTVDRGPLYVLRNLSVSCSRDEVCRYVREHVSLKREESIDAGKLKDELDRIRDHFVEEGFFNMDITFEVVPIKEERERFGAFLKKLRLTNVKPVNLIIKVKEGKHYTVEFRGVRRSKELFKLLTFKSARAIDEFEMENSRRAVEEFFKDRGYPDVKVLTSMEEVEPGEVKVIFNVKKGKLLKVRSVSANVKLSKEERKIASEMENRSFSLSKLKRLISSIRDRLKDEGYADAEVDYSFQNGTLRIEVNRGRRYLIRKAEFIGDTENCSKTVEIPEVYSRKNIKAVKSSIIGCYRNRGYVDAKVKVEEDFKPSSNKVDVFCRFRVEKGRMCRFGYVLIDGLKRTRISMIKSLIVIKPLSPYSEDLISRQYSILSNSQLFSSVNIKEFRTGNLINVLIRLTEGSKLHVKGFAGYGTDSGYVINGFAGSYSPFGFGLKFSLFGNYRRKKGYDAVFKVSKPGFLSFRNELSYSIVKKEQIFESFKADRTLSRVNLKRESRENVFVNLGLEVSRERIRDTSINERKHYLKREVYADLTYDMRDSRSNPKNGYMVYVKGAYAGRLLGGNTDYYLVETRLSAVKTVLKRLTLAGRVGFGAIEPFTNREIPLQDRFFLGGAESVRGYKFGTISPTDGSGNFIGGNCYGLINAEMRLTVRKNLQVALFYDSGEVFRKASDFRVNLSNWHSSVGFGFRYITPVGPLRLDYGYKLKSVPGQGRGRVHISFGFPF